MPQSERVRVFNGELKKTSGGLTAKDLIRNKRGKIVSRKKSLQAAHVDNNLGSWLRGKGDKFEGKPKGFKEPEPKKQEPKKPEPKKQKKQEPKKQEPKKQKKPEPKKQKPKKQKRQKRPEPKKQKKKPKSAQRAGEQEPMKPGEKPNMSEISVGNIIVPKKLDIEAERKMFEDMGLSKKEIEELLAMGGALPNAAKVRKYLKATKRRGKRRTKKQLLQDVIDL